MISEFIKSFDVSFKLKDITANDEKIRNVIDIVFVPAGDGYFSHSALHFREFERYISRTDINADDIVVKFANFLNKLHNSISAKKMRIDVFWSDFNQAQIVIDNAIDISGLMRIMRISDDILSRLKNQDIKFRVISMNEFRNDDFGSSSFISLETDSYNAKFASCMSAIERLSTLDFIAWYTDDNIDYLKSVYLKVIAECLF